MKIITLLLPVVLLFTSFVSAEKLIVPKQYATIQSAIDAAVTGDQIIILPGTYYESLVLSGKGISIIGDSGPYETTIDATGIVGSVFSSVNNPDPKDPDPPPYLDDSISGLTLTGGTGTEHPVWGPRQGGAIFAFMTSISVSNCNIIGNQAEFAGGIWMQEADSVISNVHFEDNHTINEQGGGGGLYLWDSTTYVHDCTFVNNTGLGGGGALRCKAPATGGTDLIRNCSFTGNSTPAFGGAVTVVRASPTFELCSFSSNEAGTFGGAVSVTDSQVDIISCFFSNNTATFVGGGLRVDESGAVVEKCQFMQNTALYGGGGIVVSGLNEPSVCSVSASSFEDNDGGSNGGGIHHTFIASSDVDSSTFCGNIEVPITGDWNDLGGNSMSASCSFFCGGDIDANGLVNVEDILSLLSEWGPCDGITSCFSDQNEDGVVDVNDLLMLIANWGTCG